MKLNLCMFAQANANNYVQLGQEVSVSAYLLAYVSNNIARCPSHVGRTRRSRSYQIILRCFDRPFASQITHADRFLADDMS